jgi:hypothetical protein
LFQLFKPDISDLTDEWLETDNQTIGLAGDILSVALVSNQKTDPTIIEIAKFVLQNEKFASKAMSSAAKEIYEALSRYNN